jgi:hypothetical protein
VPCNNGIFILIFQKRENFRRAGPADGKTFLEIRRGREIPVTLLSPQRAILMSGFVSV